MKGTQPETVTQESKYIKHMIDFSQNEAFIKNAFLYCAKQRINKPYDVGNNATIISELLKYFTGNVSEYDLTKGMYLYGSYGVGKTTLMYAINSCINTIAPLDGSGKKVNPNAFMSASIETIVEHFKKEGNLVRFGYDEVKRHFCIHEFGKKTTEKIYGTEVNSIIESLFMIRYELYQEGYLTHVTSNYSPFDIDIPAIIMDRMVEMFNFVEIKGDSLRK